MSDDIKIQLAQVKDHDRILEFLRIHYYHEEPLTVGSEPKQQDPEDEEFNMSNIAHGLSFIAVERNGANGKESVVGLIIIGPKDRTEAQHLFEEAARLGPTKWGRTLKFLAFVERDANVFEKYGVTKAAHTQILAVDKRMRGKAIGQRLLKDAIALARNHGFRLMTIDCTSVYSARICEKMNMDCVNTSRYADYLDDKGKQVFCPPAPHDCTKTFALRLEPSKPTISNL